MNSNLRNAMQYIINTNGGADKETFIDDHEPVGHALWRDLTDAGFAKENPAGAVVLTERGKAALVVFA